ncbi:nucleoside hydrolase [Acaricomes phytoseiuli]|uniref:nucleoside hydrolase n=1 Tax=Acaricomes phytoseiuli TaxID=291968 RepID=UPI00037C6CC3|nr:nucleoside hydrolase [Acaricomes phytoseiuli]MCW1249728.1 nucleoside hydrolase [Acaricomes phytoseiuli]
MPLTDGPRVPLLLDVDTGIDDSLALLYLLASPEAEILGISCTAGNVPAPQVAVNNLAWLELCAPAFSTGAPEEIEVSLGSEVPLLAPLMTTEDTHGPQGIGYAELPRPRRPVSERHAARLWSETVRERPGQITGLITGPLTNLALAIRLDPELPFLLKRIVIMGGCFNHPGNTTPVSEWNIAVDPEAAKLVLDAFSALPPERQPIICPLDVTESVVMTPEHLARLSVAAGCESPERPDQQDPPGTRSTAANELIRQFSDAVRFYFEFHRDHGQGYLSHMHDPFAAAVALNPEIVRLRHTTADVELAGSLTRGATIADWQGHWGRPRNAWVGLETDPERFFDQLIERVGALARRLDQSGRSGSAQDRRR